MLRLRENVLSALDALRDNWLRSSLTMLGMIIGVGSVVLLISIGRGVEEDVNRQIESIGPGTVIVVPGKLLPDGTPNFMATLGITTLTDRDVASLRALPQVQECVPFMFVGGTVERAGKFYAATLIATRDGIDRIRPHPFDEGRFFTTAESSANVCVLAHEPKQEIVGAGPAVGQSILIRGVSFRVVGVYHREDDTLFGPLSFGSVIYVPIDAARADFHGGQVNRIVLKLDYRRDPDAALAAVRTTLLRNHDGKEDFGLLDTKKLLRTVNLLSTIVTSLVACIGAISLVVAGIGIMNIMLVTVTERTREIGIRKAVGAKSRDIFLQFLTESVVLATVGGAAGTVVASWTASGIARFTALKPVVTIGAVALAGFVCCAVGVVFGVAPAMRAAGQDPIAALRYE